FEVYTPPLAGSTRTDVERSQAYFTRNPDETLIIGTLQSTTTRLTLGYAVLTEGKLSNFQAVPQAQAVVRNFVKQWKIRRAEKPVPEGATIASPIYRLQGPQLATLQQSILENPRVSQRVKEMARVVIPQATSITTKTYRTSARIQDRDFF